jgi:hypothetical protein
MFAVPHAEKASQQLAAGEDWDIPGQPGAGVTLGEGLVSMGGSTWGITYTSAVTGIVLRYTEPITCTIMILS